MKIKLILFLGLLIIPTFIQGKLSPKIVGNVDYVLTTREHTYINIQLSSNYKISTLSFWIYDMELGKWRFNSIYIDEKQFIYNLYSIHTPNPTSIYWAAVNEVGEMLYSGQYQKL